MEKLKPPSSFPKHFKYEMNTRTIVVEFEDGSIIRYHGTDVKREDGSIIHNHEMNPELSFLSFPNTGTPNADFINFLKANPRIKQEVIRAANPEYQPGEPGQNAAEISRQQNGITRENTTPSWLSGWGYKPEMQTKKTEKQDGVVNNDGLHVSQIS